MLKRIHIENMFSHKNVTFTFDRGLTGIIGPNETGKSLIIEAIRFGLFGSEALRGKAEDYKKLHVELDFEVNGVAYTVIRKSNKVELVGIATGTRPVNEAITRILGYDLAVFDVANSCNQGSIEALSNMRPSERKAMVDRTIGLDQLDELVKFAGSEATALRRQAVDLRGMMNEPVLPIQPEDYMSSTEVKPALDLARKELAEFYRLQGELSNAPAEPALVRAEVETLLAAEYAAVQEKRDLEAYIAKAVRQPGAPSACSVTDDEASLMTWQAEREDLINRTRAIRILTPEPYSAEELDAFELQIAAHNLWLERKRLLAQGHICCPNCDHKWPIAGNIPEVEETAACPVSASDIRKYRGLLGNKARLETVKDLVIPQDRSADLAVVRSYRGQMQQYEAALVAYELYNSDLPAKKERLAALATAGAEIETLKAELWYFKNGAKIARLAALAATPGTATMLEAAFSEFSRYEVDLERYSVDFQKFKSISDKLSSIEKESEEFSLARERIVDLKSKIKTHLLPSLNQVASTLLSRMTGGERYLVEVDEEFDIRVDGQPIGTLSGSGKAVANLAIRIALGQILTNRVFSVFMADEVDAAMDEERAEHTAEALRRLTSLVGQVVLVTHKRPEVDHLIELKKA